MLYRKCECGCGKWVAITSRAGNNKFYNTKHRQNYHNKMNREEATIEVPAARVIRWEDMTPCERWEAMSLEELQTVGIELGLDYGKMQVMYYSGTLPEDFGLKGKKGK